MELMGVHEIAEFLGISKQRVNQLSWNHSSFPDPVAALACGPIWDADAIREFKLVHRKPGRPKGVK